ncbi:MAG: GWxTD domain-containing protein [Candidatus Cloacimonetes bacterium]|nr:GWxTD domain-containing protein [Candidatus Cloacimonadota bacterium]
MKKLVTIIFLISSVSSLFAENLNISVDQNRFLDSSNNTIFEINYQIPYRELDFQRDSLGFVTRLEVKFSLQKNEKIVYADEFVNKIVLTNQELTRSDNYFSDKISLTLAKSDYLIRINFEDLNRNITAEWENKLEILPPQTLISDVEFSFKIISDTTAFLQKFHREKNLFQVNCNHIYLTDEFEKMCFYYELQNFRLDSENSCDLTETIRICRKEEIIREFQDKISESSIKIPRIHKIEISDLEAGYYEVVIEISDNIGNRKDVIKDYFSIKETKELEKRLFIDIEDEFNLARYFLSSSQANIWKTLSEKGKKNFLNRFWSANDPDPSTEENEFFEIVKTRVEYCNKNYSHFKDGWETDRGRIYIKHGAPDDILKLETGFYTKYSRKDYVIWKYRTTTDLTYIFIDLQANGNYKLIYVENDEDESTSPNWQDYLGKDFDEGLLY